MFSKKKETPNPGRRRPTSSAGAGGSAVFSYHANRSAPIAGPQHRTSEAARQAIAARQTKRLGRLRRGPVLAAGIVLAVLVVLNMFLGSQPKVVTVGDAKGRIFLRNPQAYSDAASEILNSALLNRTKLTVDADKLAKEMRAKFPELDYVSISVPFIGHQPTVYIQPASPRLLLSSTVDHETFVIDRNGRALIRASQVSHLDALRLPVVGDQSSLSVTEGQGVLPSSSVAFITEVVGQLKAANLSVTSLLLPAGTNELDVKVSGAAYSIKFNLMGTARVEAGAFLAVKQQLEREHKTPGQYIDVRVEDRAYYK